MSIDYTGGVAGRDPIGKTMVESFLAQHPNESDEQIHARMCRAWNSVPGSGEMPIPVDEIAHWRAGWTAR
ncbi:hypothetical protein FHR83_006767 [Actinoplanes campanulatus]|uniref:Uncharacterized protein n=1 Tax=Actinoplanes campanulatus TaxID=113559 RepID=A0A7W5AMK7_9ACTN|nr:hypothetical protein [Actinoplanes campanulatus]MBB3099061.1 hypothetical protein [Actinoplanes campanulatus]GGN39220.1 hypothetical protein GCM10010109_66910 [Actinoplanes campanulatus]GID40218.1 hypothetical protein Aca09nite_67240 [Actinoplanes campanulatus]